MTQGLYENRSPAAEQYVRALTSLYAMGYRLYDPSSAMAGDPDVEHKMLQWPAIVAPLQIRHTTIAGRKYSVVPVDQSNEDEKRLARLAQKALGQIQGFTAARLNLARADVTGARYAEIVWARRPIRLEGGDMARDWVVPIKLRDMAKENFQWTPVRDSERLRARFQYAKKDPQGSYKWVDVPTDAPLIRHVIMDSEERLGYGRGLRDVLQYLFAAMTRVFEADIQAAERFGHGWLVLKLDEEAKSGMTTNTALVEAAQDRLNAMRARHSFVVNKGDEIEIMAPPSGAQGFMADLSDRLNKMADRVIMGGTLFSGGESGEGSRARADTELETATGIFDVYADMLEETLTRDLVHRWCKENQPVLREIGLGDVEWPRYSVVRGRDQDPRDAAERAEIVLRSGAKIKRDEYYDAVGFTPPGEDDDVIEQAPQMRGGGFASLMNGLRHL